MNYYNEIDKHAVIWLKSLISAGLIPKGDVDDRSIKDVKGSDLTGYTQCHFFAGIGGWAKALELAGVSPDVPIWTGSCPCQSLSVAGLGKGAEDERHLWPEFCRIIAECEPSTVFGEQVASKLGREWLAGVRLDLEEMGYAVGAADLCAAGIGAPHIRQRLWWVANADGMRLQEYGLLESGLSVQASENSRLADSDRLGTKREQSEHRERCGVKQDGERCGISRLEDTIGTGTGDNSSQVSEQGRNALDTGRTCLRQGHEEIGTDRINADGSGGRVENPEPVGRRRRGDEDNTWENRTIQIEGSSTVSRLVNTNDSRFSEQCGAESIQQEQSGVELSSQYSGLDDTNLHEYSRRRRSAKEENCIQEINREKMVCGELGGTGSFWQNSIYIPCGDGKQRRIKPGLKCLVNGLPGRVAQLRGLGNAIVPQLAAVFIKSYMESDK